MPGTNTLAYLSFALVLTKKFYNLAEYFLHLILHKMLMLSALLENIILN
jgi:hypothetical protein